MVTISQNDGLWSVPVMPGPACKQRIVCAFFQKRAIDLQAAVSGTGEPSRSSVRAPTWSPDTGHPLLPFLAVIITVASRSTRIRWCSGVEVDETTPRFIESCGIPLSRQVLGRQGTIRIGRGYSCISVHAVQSHCPVRNGGVLFPPCLLGGPSPCLRSVG
jgi:hypothetical protein